MEYEIEDNVLVAKLDDDMPLFDALEQIMQEIDQSSAVVISGIGMITDFKVGFYNRQTKGYEWEKFDEPKELLSIKGSITEDKDMHLHVEVAGEDHKVSGGHLEGGKIFNVAELTMLVFDELNLTRKRNDRLDMDLLSVR